MNEENNIKNDILFQKDIQLYDEFNDKWKYQRKSCVNCEYKIICAGECSETLK